MSDTKPKTYDWDATASFSWYLYQADVALFFALKKILALKNLWNDNEIENWTLEVEWEEDFSLFDNVNNIKELYQVKETYSTEAKYYTLPVIKLYESFKVWWNKKEFLITTNNLWQVDNISFFDWLYSRDNLTKGQTKLKYLFENDTFLKEKIIFEKDTYKFKDTETKDTIKDYVLQNVSDFIKDENFSYHCWGAFSDVQWNIKELISTLRIKYLKPDNVNTEHYLRFLESIVKRFIQRRKIDWLIETISLKEIILDSVLKNWDDIFDELVKDSFYQDIFIDFFIEKFNLKVVEIKGNNVFDKIKNDSSIDYDFLIDKFKETISFNIFSNNIKNLVFIRNISPKDSLSYLDSWIKKENLNTLLNNTSSFIDTDKIENKIILLVKLFYLKEKWLTFEINKYFSDKEGDSLEFSINNKKAILTWANGLVWSKSKDDIIKILNTNIDILYEKHFIWVIDSAWFINNFLNLKSNIDEEKFLTDNPWIQNSLLENDKNITEIKNIKIFCCWCSVSNKEKMLSDECWNKYDCEFKN